MVIYISRNGRWNSPKFLIGESYGTFRSVALANYLQSERGIYINGIVLISTGLDFGTIEPNLGDDRSYIFHVPSYAAAAWYYKTLIFFRARFPRPKADAERRTVPVRPAHQNSTVRTIAGPVSLRGSGPPRRLAKRWRKHARRGSKTTALSKANSARLSRRRWRMRPGVSPDNAMLLKSNRNSAENLHRQSAECRCYNSALV